MMFVFSVIAVVLQLHSVAWSRPIPTEKPVELEATNGLHWYEEINYNNPMAEVITMVHSSYGVFRDPVEVLGPSFPVSKTINTCELHITLQADLVVEIQLTERGRKVCRDVCDRYMNNVITDGPANVTLSQDYCDHTTSGSGVTIEDVDLLTTCICAYNVRYDSWTSVIVHSFQVNSEGHMKVFMQPCRNPSREKLRGN